MKYLDDTEHSAAVGYVRSMHGDPAWLDRSDAVVRARGLNLATR